MVKLNKIYTRTGDDGTTGLIDGSRVAKGALIIHAIGDVDTLNSALGLALTAIEDAKSDWHADIVRIQNDLFDLGADLATPLRDEADSQNDLRIVSSQWKWLEQRIDNLVSTVEPLKSFVLPGGSELAARVHLARSLARQAERQAQAASAEQALNADALIYLNRLSDFLFTLARAINATAGGDVLWVPGSSRE